VAAVAADDDDHNDGAASLKGAGATNFCAAGKLSKNVF